MRFHQGYPHSVLRHLIVLLFLLSLVFSLSLPYRDIPLAIDSSIFAAVGLHLNHDKVLYRDAWDHKPPLVFFLNALALRVGGESHTAIRDLQTVFGCLILLVFYFLSWVVFRSVLVSSFCSSLFLLSFYHPTIYGGGNFTEEYGTFFVLMGVLGIALWSFRYQRRNSLPLFLAGVGFGAAALTKEPFVFSFAPWLVYVLLLSLPGWKTRFRNVATLTLCCTLPSVVPLIYFLKHHALDSWGEVIRYGFQYADRFSEDTFLQKQSEGLPRVAELIFSNSTLLIIFFILGMASLSQRNFLKRTRYFPLFTLYWVVFSFFATSLSGMFFLHYYLQMIAPILVLCAAGFYFLVRWLGGQPTRVKWVGGSVLFFFATIDFTLPGMLVDSPPLPSNETEDLVLEYLDENRKAGDTLWVSNGYLARYYLETGMLSPTRYLAVFSHHLQLESSPRLDPKKLDEIYRDLMDAPPDFLVGSDLLRFPYYRKDYTDWFQTRYSVTPLGPEESPVLVFSRTADVSESLSEQKKDWASKEAQSANNLSEYQTYLLRLLQGSAPQWF